MAEDLDVAAALSGQHVFITGATGFIGKVLVEKLLWSVPEVAGLSLLIRAGSQEEADRRQRQEIFDSPPFARLRARHGDAWESWARDKVRAVPGDVGRDRFGLAEGAYLELCRRVQRVVGCAAAVTFDERLDRAVEINARGAERTLALARDGGGLPLVHVSTCFVCGDRRGSVLERPLGGDAEGPGRLDGEGTLAALARACRAARAEAAGEDGAPFVAAGAEQAERYGFHDVYTLTKALAETLVLDGRGAVPLAIVRPAIVESARTEPLPGWLQAVRVVDPLLAAYGRGLVRDIPGTADVGLEIVPVDMVANLLVAALAELPAAPQAGSPPEPRVYQLGSARNPVTLGELMEHAREGFRRHPVENGNGEPVRLPKARFVPADRLADQVAARLSTVRRRARRWARLGARRRAARGAPEERRLEYLLRLIRVYRPYLTPGPVFDDRATRSLRERLTAASRRDFGFDVAAVDWRRYLAEVHVPGLVRFVLGSTGAVPRHAGDRSATASRDGGRQLAEAGQRAAAAASLWALFAAVADAHPELAAFQTHRDGAWLRYSYSQARDAAINVAWRMAREYGVAHGDRVVLWAGGSPEWTVTALAAWRLGAVVVPVDPQWPMGEALEAARLVDAKLLCAAPGKAGAAHAADGGPAVAVVPLAAPFVPEPGVGPLPGAREVVAAEVGEEDGATVLFTSGTTVAPKAVPLSHGNYLANVRDLVPLMRLTRERMLSLLPVHHAFEQTVGLLVPMAGASTVSYVTEVKPEEIRWMMASTRPTVMVAVPRLLELLHAGILRSVDEGGPALRLLFKGLFALSKLTGGRVGHKLFAKVHRRFGGALRRIASGGSALEPALGESFRLMGFRIAEGYGMTETSPVLTVNSWDEIRFGTVGRPLPGVEVELRPPEEGAGGAYGEADEGEIWVRGANVMAGYLHDPGASARVLRDGWLNTGDLGRFDADGYLVLSGRTKDVIVTGAGKNVHPEEVEARYRGLPGVEEMVVLGLPARGGGGGEVVAAVVVPAPGDGDGVADPDAIRDAVEERSAGLPSYQRITRLEIWRGDLPKTTTMKVKRGRLRDAVLAAEGGAAGPVPTGPAPAAPRPEPARPRLTETEAWVMETVARLANTRPEEFTIDTRLAGLGLDSLAHAELVGAVERRAGRRMEDGVTFVRLEDLCRVLDPPEPVQTPG